MTSVNADRNRRQLLIWTIAALSGAAGLGYEMVWTRLLGVALGTEMQAVLGSIAGLFAGLAAGGWLLDGAVRRTRRPAVLYALLELVIAAWGVVCVVVLPGLARWLPPLLGPTPAPGLMWSVAFIVPAVVLAPATLAMGGTLAALTRMLAARSAGTPVVAGAYAANTFGAVLGTLATVGLLFGAVGLRGTLLCLAAMNALAAAGAFWLARESPARSDAADASQVEPRWQPGDGRRLTTLFATGVLGVAVEVVIVRAAAQFLSDTIYTFAGLLAAYLLGSSLGGALRQRIRARDRAASRAIGLSLAALTVLGTLLIVPSVARWVGSLGLIDGWTEAVVAGVLFIPCAMAMGVVFADLLEEYGGVHRSIGRAAGVNAAGAALAPAIAALLLLPGLGAMSALWWLGVGYLGLLPWRPRVLAWAAAPLLLAAFLVYSPVPLPVGLPPGGQVVASIEGPMVAASVVDDASGARYLEVNGHFRMGGTSSERSDFRQALLPLVLHAHPRDALYLGVGTGATVAGALRYPGLSLKGIEISAEVVGLLPYFSVPGRADPAPVVQVADARRYVAAQRARYDVIVADNFHPALEGSGALYTVEHFRAVRARLRGTGLFCQWLPLYQLDERSLRDITRSFLDVFPDASAWLAHYSIRMPMLALCGTADGQGLDLTGLDARLGNPALAEVLRPIDLDQALGVIGTALGDATALAHFAGPGDLNRDDRPLIALNGRGNIAALSAPPEDLLLTLVRALRPQTPRRMPAAIEPARISAYWRARDRFLEAGAALHGSPSGRALIEAAVPGLLASIRESAEFEPAYRPLLSMAGALAQDDPGAARTLLQAIDAAAPARPEAQQMLRELPVSVTPGQGEKRIR